MIFAVLVVRDRPHHVVLILIFKLVSFFAFIANNSVVDDNGNPADTSEPVDDKDDNVVDNIDDPLCNLINHDDGDRQALIAEQKSDTTLQPCWQLAKQRKGGMVVEDGILYHNYVVCGHAIKQL